MNSTIFDHNWTHNARECAAHRYFSLCDAPTQTHEDLNPVYDTWQALADMSMMHRFNNRNIRGL